MVRGTRHSLAAIVTAFSSVATPLSAQELNPVRQGIALYGAGDLEGALARFSEAEGATDLARDEFLTLLQYRATIQHALGNASGRDQALEQLAALEPDANWLDVVPPEVRELFVALDTGGASRLRLIVSEERVRSGVEIRVRLENDANLAREIAIETSLDAATWERTLGRNARVIAREDQRVLYRVEVRGPGGILLAREEADAPGTLATEAHARSQVANTGPPHDTPIDEDGAASTYLWVGITAAVLAGSLSAYFLLSREETNRVEPPVVGW